MSPRQRAMMRGWIHSVNEMCQTYLDNTVDLFEGREPPNWKPASEKIRKDN